MQILVEGGDPKERQFAKTILPMRKRGNLLLCTLLLGNTLTNCALSILLADLTTGAIGLATSTFIIVIFGEVRYTSCSHKPPTTAAVARGWRLRLTSNSSKF